MKKRLRKKKHLGEFREYGFGIKFMPQSADFDMWISIMDRFDAFVTPFSLGFGGGGMDQVEWYICRDGKGSCHEGHRQLISAWLAAQPEITSHEVEPLTDAWYGPWF